MALVRLAHTELEAWIEQQLLTRGSILIPVSHLEAGVPALRRVIHQLAKKHNRKAKTRLKDVVDNPDLQVLYAEFTDWPRDEAERAMQAEQLARARAAYEAGLQPGQPRPPRKRNR